jgi:hypothetical protein
MIEVKQRYQWKDHPQAFISIMSIKEDYVNVYNFQIPSSIGPSVGQFKILELEELINNGKLIRIKI